MLGGSGGPSARVWRRRRAIRRSRRGRVPEGEPSDGGRIVAVGTDPITIPVLRLVHAAGLPLPEYASPGSSGLDLRAAVEAELSVEPGERVQIPTGLILELPTGWEGQVRPRSGLAWRHGVTMLNTPGTIDSDYRGEVKVILVNLGQPVFVVQRGDRIAQLVIAPVSRAILVEVEELGSTARGEGGFGSTGVG